MFKEECLHGWRFHHEVLRTIDQRFETRQKILDQNIHALPPPPPDDLLIGGTVALPFDGTPSDKFLKDKNN